MFSDDYLGIAGVFQMVYKDTLPYVSILFIILDRKLVIIASKN